MLDPAQQMVKQIFDELLVNLINRNRLLYRYFSCFQSDIKGIYLFGSVGRGKTMLMDQFFDNVPFLEKKRLHFHTFMRILHGSLQNNPGMKDPLDHFIQAFAKNTRVLCVDEFLITDIADAMLFVGLLQALSRYKVLLVVTSNVPPEDLYRNGLQRSRFLPAIDWLYQHMQMVHLADGIDYRLHFGRTLAKSGLWEKVSGIVPQKNETIRINHREISILYQANGLIWFEFDALCNTYRSAEDYVVIASLYHTVLISHVPILHNEEAAKRFIDLIDVLYDAHTTVGIEAMNGIDELYPGDRWRFEFTRTRSRLWEMLT